MQASERHSFDASDGFYEPSAKEPECKHRSPNAIIDYIICCDDSSLETNLLIQTFDQCCTLEASAANGSVHSRTSLSTIAHSPDGSLTSRLDSQPHPSDLHHFSDDLDTVCEVSRTNDSDDLTLKLRELESAMLGPYPDALDRSGMDGLSESNIMSPEESELKRLMEMISRGDLKEIIHACAKALEENDMLRVEWLISELRPMVSVSGEPIQRVAAYILEGFVARLASSGSAIYKALRCKEPASADLLSYMQMLYELCPYFKFGYISANGAIAEAMREETSIHIIDFQIAQGTQWFTMIQALAARHGGPPHLRITGIDDSASAYVRGGSLEIVGKRLCRLAESCKVPFEFCAVSVPASEIEINHLEIRPGEAIAVNFPMVLHHIPDESVCFQNHRDRLLRLVKSLSPNLVTLVELESNTNTAPFTPRVVETFNYYLAVFESMDVTLPRDHKDRINVEQHCLARDIVNLIACEGLERFERHEPLGKWRARFMMAGFSPCSLSSFVNATIKSLLGSYSEMYTLEERDGALYLGWMNRPLVASCAWR